jgi:hypothetical protein
MQYLPFDKPGRFWRGNLHTHSTLSDGYRTPEEVGALYRAMGYDFLALTDHFLESFDWPIADTRPLRGDGFTTLIGAELHAPETESGSLWHILAVGLPLDFARPAESETAPMLARRALDAGAFVAIAHPGFYALTVNDALTLGDVDAVEVFNATSIDHNDRPDGWYLLDILAGMGKRFSACATDDAHFHPYRADCGLGWVMVKATHNEPEALLEALKAGDYYASTGPQLHDVRIESGDRLFVRCSPAARIFVTGTGYRAQEAHGHGITEAEFRLNALRSPYFRVTVRDAAGRRAWTSPVWLE